MYGNEKQQVAGFCIFNDISARDVQAPEFVGGFCLTKDMAEGNQLGPYLVTPDEVGDPYSLEVTVSVNGQVRFRGSTSEIDHRAEDVFAWLRFIAPLKPGSVMGMGTIPDCTGLITTTSSTRVPRFEITFERLGTLRCRFAEPAGTLSRAAGPCADHCRSPTGSARSRPDIAPEVAGDAIGRVPILPREPGQSSNRCRADGSVVGKRLRDFFSTAGASGGADTTGRTDEMKRDMAPGRPKRAGSTGNTKGGRSLPTGVQDGRDPKPDSRKDMRERVFRG